MSDVNITANIFESKSVINQYTVEPFVVLPITNNLIGSSIGLVPTIAATRNPIIASPIFTSNSLALVPTITQSNLQFIHYYFFTDSRKLTFEV